MTDKPEILPTGTPSRLRERPVFKYLKYLALYLFLGYIFFTLYGTLIR